MRVGNGFILTIHKVNTPKRFGGPKGWNWQMRDMKWSRNVVLPGANGTWTTLRECKRRAMLAYILWFTVMLLQNKRDPRNIDGEFLSV